MKFKSLLYLIIIPLVVFGVAWLFIQANLLRTKPAEVSPTPLPLIVTRISPTVPDKAIDPEPSPTTPVRIGPYVNQQAPGFTLQTLEGEQVSLEPYRGKLVLLNFWTSWCIPWKEEMPLIQQVYEEYQEKGLVVLGLNMTDLDYREDIEKFVETTGVTFPILLDEKGTVSSDYRIISIPTTFFIDREGIIRHFQLDAMSDKQLTQYFDEMLP